MDTRSTGTGRTTRNTLTGAALAVLLAAGCSAGSTDTGALERQEAARDAVARDLQAAPARLPEPRVAAESEFASVQTLAADIAADAPFAAPEDPEDEGRAFDGDAARELAEEIARLQSELRRTTEELEATRERERELRLPAAPVLVESADGRPLGVGGGHPVPDPYAMSTQPPAPGGTPPADVVYEDDPVYVERGSGDVVLISGGTRRADVVVVENAEPEVIYVEQPAVVYEQVVYETEVVYQWIPFGHTHYIGCGHHYYGCHDHAWYYDLHGHLDFHLSSHDWDLYLHYGRHGAYHYGHRGYNDHYVDGHHSFRYYDDDRADAAASRRAYRRGFRRGFGDGFTTTAGSAGPGGIAGGATPVRRRLGDDARGVPDSTTSRSSSTSDRSRTGRENPAGAVSTTSRLDGGSPRSRFGLDGATARRTPDAGGVADRRGRDAPGATSPVTRTTPDRPMITRSRSTDGDESRSRRTNGADDSTRTRFAQPGDATVAPPTRPTRTEPRTVAPRVIERRPEQSPGFTRTRSPERTPPAVRNRPRDESRPQAQPQRSRPEQTRTRTAPSRSPSPQRSAAPASPGLRRSAPDVQRSTPQRAPGPRAAPSRNRDQGGGGKTRRRSRDS